MGAFPISVWRYHARRRASTWLILATVAISTMGLLVMGSLGSSTLDTYLTRKAYLDRMALVRPVPGTILSEEELSLLEEAVGSQLVPAAFGQIETLMIAGNGYFDLLFVNHAQMLQLLKSAGTSLARGSLPRAGTGEVVIAQALAAGRGLDVGDQFGPRMGATGEAWKPFTVSGIVTGGAQIAIGSLDFARGRLPPSVAEPAHLAIDARENQVERLRKELSQIPGQAAASVESRRVVLETAKKGKSVISGVLLAIELSLAAVITVGTGIVSVLFFRRRLPEFAVLSAVGLSSSTLLGRAVGEVLSLALAGWVVGAVSGTGLLFLLAALCYIPRGISIRMVDLVTLGLSTIAPIMMTIMSYAALARGIKALDPVIIIERREL